MGPSVGYWTPRLGRSAPAEWEIETAHFAERFQLFIIIALGESIVVTGATASSLVLDLPIGTSLMVAFASSAALWWLYFDEVGWRAQRFLSRSDERGRLARDAYTYLHIPIIAGIIVVAVADEIVIAHPGSTPSGVEFGRDPGRAGLIPHGPHPVSTAHDRQCQPQTAVRGSGHRCARAAGESYSRRSALAAGVLVILVVLAGAETRNRIAAEAATASDTSVASSQA